MNKSVSMKPGKSATTTSRLTTKQRGEVAEAAFLHKVASLGFGVAKPWGDSDPFDFLVQSGSHCWRVQVKSAYAKYCGGYQTSLLGGARRRAYTARDIDFMVAYAVPEDAWYVVPVEVFKRVTQVRFYPGSKKSRYEKYRDAWCLMACPKDGECKKEISVAGLCQRSGEGELRCPRKPPP